MKRQAAILEFGTRLTGQIYVERAGVYAVIENDAQQIAVIETNQHYFLPGGGVRSGETEAEALEREILEEMGYQVLGLAEIGETIEYFEAYTDGRYYRIHSRVYQVQLGAKIGEGIEEDHRLVWLRPQDALKRLRRQSQAWAIQKVLSDSL